MEIQPQKLEKTLKSGKIRPSEVYVFCAELKKEKLKGSSSGKKRFNDTPQGGYAALPDSCVPGRARR